MTRLSQRSCGGDRCASIAHPLKRPRRTAAATVVGAAALAGAGAAFAPWRAPWAPQSLEGSRSLLWGQRWLRKSSPQERHYADDGVACRFQAVVQDPAGLTSQICNSASAEEVLGSISEQEGALLNEIHLASAFHRLAILHQSPSRRGQQNQRRNQNKPGDGFRRESARQFSLPGFDRNQAWRELISQTRDQLDRQELGGQSVANILWAIAKLQKQVPATVELVPYLVDAAQDSLATMSPQGIANIVWAVGSLRRTVTTPRIQKLMPDLIHEVSLQVNDMVPQEVCSLLWAAATLSFQAPELRDLVPTWLALLANRADTLKAMEVSSVLWAVAKLRIEADLVYDALVPMLRRGLEQISFMRDQELSNLVWSIGVIRLKGTETEELLAAARVAVQRKVYDFTGQGLSNTCWGLALHGSLSTGTALSSAEEEATNRELLDAIAKAVIGRQKQWTGKNAELSLPMIALSFARLGALERHTELAQVISSAMGRYLPTMNDWGLHALSWSFARAGPEQAAFRQFVDAELQRRGVSPDSERVEQAALLGPGGAAR